LQAFKDGDVRFLICTDVAARGIDISGLPYVINMALPDKSEDYIHRCSCFVFIAMSSFTYQ
jgi:ATP-dependent RNA helicase DDX1